MTSTIRRRKPTRRPVCELLEGRIVLSTVVATNPAPGAVLLNPPAAFRVTFDSPIDPFSLNLGDIVVDRVADDGSLAAAYDASQFPKCSTTRAPSSASTPRAPWRRAITAWSWRAPRASRGSTARRSPTPTAPICRWPTSRSPGPASGSPTPWPSDPIGATPVAVAGKLDFAANPSAVNLYQITLPAGHFYRLGAEVSAQRDGSALDAALTLFDSQGRAISSDDVGRPDAPNDPFLFAGLKPGTYYLGVSGSGNLPGLPGGYNVQTRTSGLPQTGPGGAFTLHLVADAGRPRRSSDRLLGPARRPPRPHAHRVHPAVLHAAGPRRVGLIGVRPIDVGRGPRRPEREGLAGGGRELRRPARGARLPVPGPPAARPIHPAAGRPASPGGPRRHRPDLAHDAQWRPGQLRRRPRPTAPPAPRMAASGIGEPRPPEPGRDSQGREPDVHRPARPVGHPAFGQPLPGLLQARHQSLRRRGARRHRQRQRPLPDARPRPRRPGQYGAGQPRHRPARPDVRGDRQCPGRRSR